MSQLQIQRLMRPHLVTPEAYATAVSPDEMAAKAGVSPDMIIRLNQNENPFGAAPEIAAALIDLPLHLYPDPNQSKIREALAEYTGHPAEQILAGAGSDELIDLLMRLFVAPGDRVLDCKPTFGMYHFCARIADAEVVSVPRDDAFEVDVEAIAREDDERTKIVFLASPNNPTGNLVAEQDARALLDTGVVVCVDETYYEFSDSTLCPLLDEYENLVILRSFSKWAGIAGLRVGYAIASSELIAHLMDIKQPYNINIAGEAAVLAALEHRGELLERAATLIEQRRRLEVAIDGLEGVSYYPSEGNFLLCRFERRTAEEAYVGLAQRGIFVRRFPQSVLDSSLRISAGTPEQTDLLIDALRSIV